MAREDHRVLAPQLTYQLAYAHDLFGVEPYRRLVEYEQLWVANQCLCEPHALAVAL